MNRQTRRSQRRKKQFDPNDLMQRAQADIARRDWEPAIKAYRRVVRILPDFAPAWSDLGALYLATGKSEQAEQALQRAISLDPTSPDTLSNMANLDRQSGNAAGAEEHYRKVLTLQPDRASAWHELARLKRFETSDPDVTEIRKLLKSDKLDDAGRMHALFALSKAMDDIGDYDKAFVHLHEANEIRYKQIKYDISRHEQFVDQLIDTFNPNFVDVIRDGGFLNSRVVFVLGMPRSGTSLVEQILASHNQVFGAGERTELEQVIREVWSNFPSPPDNQSAQLFQQVGKVYVQRMSKLGKARQLITDKLPQNFLYLGVIALAMPDAKIIHCRRSPLDTCLSCYGLYFPYGQSFSYNLCDIGKYYCLYRRLMDHWDKLFGDQIFEVSYEEVVAEPEREARRMVQFCGREWEPQCLNFQSTRRIVATASASQVREPIYDRSIGRWRPYQKHLSALIEALGTYADI